MAWNPTAFILFLGLVPLQVSSKLDYMSGALPLRERDNRYPLMYSSVVPLLYKFHVPKWDAHSMKIQFWKQHNNCTKDDQYSSGYPCPILHHMHPITDQFLENMTSWTNLFVESELHQSFLPDEFTNSQSQNSICNDLRFEPHFRSLTVTTSRQLNDYIKVMTQCAQMNGTVFNLKIINMTGIPSYLEELYHDTFKSFTADYWAILTDANRESAALVAWTALQGALMTNHLMEVQKWTQAVDTCKNSRVPWTLITGDSLHEQLTDLRSYLASQNQDLAVPTEEIQKYFQLPLTDCIFGDDDTFLVRLLIPVVPKDAASKNYFVRFHPVPFTALGKICSLWEEEDSIPFNLGLNGVLPCTCSKDDVFCQGWKIQDYNDKSCTSFHRHQEQCIHSISADVEEDIVRDCPIKCKPASFKKSRQLVMHQSDTTTIKIIPANPFPDRRIPLITCPTEKVTFKMEKVGAYEITHPTACRVEYVSKNSTALKGAKDNDFDLVQVEYLMPYHWRQGVMLEQDDFEEDAEEFTLADQLDKLRGVEPKLNLLANQIENVDQYCRDSLDPTWVHIFVILSIFMNIILALFVAHLYLWKVKQVKDNNRFNLLANAADFPISDES